MTTFLVLGTVAYSAYEDYRGVTTLFDAGSGRKLITVERTIQGQMVTVTLNATVPNQGLFTIEVDVSCTGQVNPNIVCTPASVTVPPGQRGTLTFQFVVKDVTKIPTGVPFHLNGTTSVAMVPVASITVGADFGAFVTGGS